MRAAFQGCMPMAHECIGQRTKFLQDPPKEAAFDRMTVLALILAAVLVTFCCAWSARCRATAERQDVGKQTRQIHQGQGRWHCASEVKLHCCPWFFGLTKTPVWSGRNFDKLGILSG